MTKPYHEMTPAERLADRIAKNRDIERRVSDSKPVAGSAPAAKTRSRTRVASKPAGSANTFDKFQEIKRTQGIDAASDYLQTRMRVAND
jgi:hypothetical protein